MSEVPSVSPYTIDQLMNMSHSEWRDIEERGGSVRVILPVGTSAIDPMAGTRIIKEEVEAEVESLISRGYCDSGAPYYIAMTVRPQPELPWWEELTAFPWYVSFSQFRENDAE